MIFRQLWEPLRRIIASNLVDPTGASALWTIPSVHSLQARPSPKRGVMVTDNYYIKHSLPMQTDKSSDGEVKCLGTVKITSTDGLNCAHLKDAHL